MTLPVAFVDFAPVPRRASRPSTAAVDRYQQQHQHYSHPRRRVRVFPACCDTMPSRSQDASPQPPPAPPPPPPPSSSQTPFPIDGFIDDDLDFDEDVVSDDTHVVIDSKDVSNLIRNLQLSGQDDLLGGDGIIPTATQPDVDADQNANADPPGFDSDFFDAAERLSDEREGRISSVGRRLPLGGIDGQNDSTPAVIDSLEHAHTPDSTAPAPASEPQSEPASAPTPEVVEVDEKDLVQINDMVAAEPMTYFQTENAAYMPSWVREMYERNEHTTLMDASPNTHDMYSRRLHDIVERKPASPDAVTVGGDGIVDCTIVDVADDYRVPIEFVTDVCVSMGVPIPIRNGQSIRNTLTSEQVRRLLDILIRHDPATLAERYSDRCIDELAADYDLEPEVIMKACAREAFYMHNGHNTHLSVVREDRILDILLNNEPFGRPYPSLLDGLE